MLEGDSTPARRTGAVAAAAAALALAAVHPAPAQDGGTDRIRVVALDGDDVDGFAPGEALHAIGSRDEMAVAADGTVLFDGEATDGQTLRPGRFLASGGVVTPVLHRYEAAPPPFGAWTVGNIQSTRLGRDGSVGFELHLAGSPPTDALATWIDGAFTWAASDPGDFIDIPLGAQACNGGNLVFLGTVESAPVEPRFQSGTRGVWRRTGAAAPLPLIRQDDPVPGLPGRVVATIFTVPIVHESGAAAFEVRLDGSSSSPGSALLVHPAPGSSAGPFLACTHDSGDTLHRFTFGELGQGEDIPRWAYLVSDATGTHVVESARGTVLSDDQVAGGFTVQLDADARIALADDGQVIVLAKATTPGGVVEAIWRCVPDQEPVCEFHVGRTIDDVTGTPRTVKDIWNVHVNEQGRIAAEVDLDFFGTTQCIVIQDDPGGPYRVALQQRETFAADRDDYRIVSIQSQKPNPFTLTDPGHDGRQSRFAANGDFVFSATVDTADDATDRRGVFVLGGVAPELCDIEAKVRGGDLVLTGDDCDSVLTVRVLGGGDYILVPGEGTSVNGKEGEVPLSAGGGLRASMGGGRDTLVVASAYGEDAPGSIPGSLAVDMGPGDDGLTVDFVDTAGDLSVGMGGGPGLLEKVLLDACDVGGNLGVVCGPTRTLCDLAGVGVAGTTFVQHGGNQGYVTSEACAFGGALFRGTGDVESFTFRGCILGGPLKVDLAGGLLGTVLFTGCEGEDAPVTVDARRSGSVSFRFEDCDLDRGALKLTTGTLGSTVALVGTTVTDDVQVKTSGVGTDGNLVNTLSFQNSSIHGRLKVRGKGSHTVSILGQGLAGGGIDLRTKGGIFDRFTVSTDVAVFGAGIKLASTAAQGSRVVLDDVSVEEGALSIKGTRGPDEVTVTNASLQGGAVVKLGSGDDSLTMGAVDSPSRVKVDGGPGTDTFDGTADPGNVAGGITSRKFEAGTGPGVPGAE